ncbi:MAG: alpha/beta fold hydrolase [Hyphomicrobiales bacterium]
MTQGSFDGTVFETRGEGPPVVLIHGLGLHRGMWDRYADALSARFHVVSYDILGHGETARPPGPYSMARFTDQLLGLLDHLEVERAGLVGFSFGGMINRAFAIAHPDRVAALGILCTAHDRTAEQRAAVLQRVEQARRSGPGATVDAALERWFTEPYAAEHPEVLDQVRRWIMANDRDVYPHIYKVMATCDADLIVPAASIRCPTLIAACDGDLGNSPEMARAMGQGIAGARVEIVEGLKHMGLYERPEVFLALLEPFLAESLG